MNRKDMMHRNLKLEQMRAMEENDDLILEGYFAVFDSEYKITDTMSESIARGAFTNTLKDDIDKKVLYNHNPDKILGREKNKTCEFIEDDKGLYVRTKINKNDTEALNCYERVKRGDVDQCSIGFAIVSEEYSKRGSKHHWTITEVKLFEASICVFPAYEETTVSARQKDVENMEKRQKEVWEKEMLQKLKGE